MISLVQTVRIGHVRPYDDLAAVFTTLYGSVGYSYSSLVDYKITDTSVYQGTVKSTSGICNDYWTCMTALKPSDNRSEILQEAKFPLFPSALPELLHALNGRGDRSTRDDPADDTSSVKKAFEYVSSIQGITTMVVEQDGVTKRELKKGGIVNITLLQDLILPSGQIIPAKTDGQYLGQTNGLAGTRTIVRWNIALSGWDILSSLLLAAVGDRALAERWSQFIDTSDLTAVLNSVLGFVKDAVQVRPDLVKGLINSEDLSDSTIAKPSGPDLLSIACALLQKESVARQDPKWQKSVGAAFGIARCLLPKYPRRIWSELRRASFFPSSSSSHNILQVLINQGNASGQYELVIAALHLVEALVDDVELGQFQQEAQVLYVRSNATASTINFLHQAVWTRHRGWRYADGRQKAQITSSLTVIYNKVLRNPTYTSQFADSTAQVPLSVVNAAVWDQLVVTSSDVDLLPISDVIKAPIYGIATSSGAASSSAEHAAAVSDILELAYRLLSIGLTAGVDGSAGLLRVICSFTAASEDAAHFIEAVFDIVTSPYTRDATVIYGLRLLTILMIYAAGVVQTPLSFVACLKSPKHTSEEFTSLLSAGGRSADAQDAAWTALRTMLAVQPALGRLCLFAEGVEGRGRSAGLQTALDIISTWNAAEHDPRMLARAIGLVKDIYQYQPDLIEKMSLGKMPGSTTTDENSTAGKLWKAICTAAAELNPPLRKIDVAMDLSSDDGQEAVSEMVSGCYRREAKGLAISLLATVLEGFDGQTGKETEGREDLASALSLLYVVSPPDPQSQDEAKNKASERLKRLMSDSVGQSFDPGLRSDALEEVRRILPISSFDGLSEKEPLALRRFGEQYSFGEISASWLTVLG